MLTTRDLKFVRALVGDENEATKIGNLMEGKEYTEMLLRLRKAGMVTISHGETSDPFDVDIFVVKESVPIAIDDYCQTYVYPE